MKHQSLPFLFSIVSLYDNHFCRAVRMNPSLPKFPLETATADHDIQNAFVRVDPRVGPPPRFQIGLINDEETEFNVGNGFTDESKSRNIIYIQNTSGTNLGLVNHMKLESRTVPGTLFYDFIVLAPGCTRLGDTQAIQVKSHFTGYDSVDVTLAVYPWHGTVHDVNGDQSEFSVCLQAAIFIVDGTGVPQLVESKQFDFEVTVLVASFAFKKEDAIALLAVERWPRPCA